MPRADESQYEECFVAYLDILGFESLVKRSLKNSQVFECLTKVLNYAADLPSGTKHSRFEDPDGNLVEQSWRIQTRAFSDTIVIFMPVKSGSIGQVLFLVRFLHDRMLELGLILRGAVTIGGMYWNDAWSRDRDDPPERDRLYYDRNDVRDGPISLGPGLIEAYRLEDECAVYPRILISDELCKYLHRYDVGCISIGSYGDPNRPLLDFVRTDVDGLRFFDLLHPDIVRNDTEKIVRRTNDDGGSSIQWIRDANTHDTVIDKLRDLINEQLRDRQSPVKVKAKYEWLNSYLNSMTGVQS